jgi:hypothetical protein
LITVSEYAAVRRIPVTIAMVRYITVAWVTAASAATSAVVEVPAPELEVLAVLSTVTASAGVSSVAAAVAALVLVEELPAAVTVRPVEVLEPEVLEPLPVLEPVLGLLELLELVVPAAVSVEPSLEPESLTGRSETVMV